MADEMLEAEPTSGGMDTSGIESKLGAIEQILRQIAAELSQFKTSVDRAIE